MELLYVQDMCAMVLCGHPLSGPDLISRVWNVPHWAAYNPISV